MAEYIEREALLAAYDAAHVGPPGGARKLMAEAPAADVAPVMHGRWERSYEETLGWIDRCSQCKTVANDPKKYCPNCGSRMDGDRK